LKKPSAFFVVSNYFNNVDWIEDYTDDYIIFDKSNSLPEGEKIVKLENVGQNIFDIFCFIVYNYDNLPEYTAFLQGDPFPHCKRETFDKLIYNEYFTSIEDYSHVPESPSRKFSETGGYLEANTNWYLLLDPPYKHRYYNSHYEFMNDIFVDVPFYYYIRFCPGAQFIVPKSKSKKYNWLRLWK